MYTSLPKGIHQEFGVCPFKYCLYTFIAYNVSINVYNAVLHGFKMHKNGITFYFPQLAFLCNNVFLRSIFDEMYIYIYIFDRYTARSFILTVI